MNARSISAAAVAPLVGVLLLLASPVAALGDAGWISNDTSHLPFRVGSSTVVHLAGARGLDGGCAGTFTLHKNEGDPPVVAVEIAANPITCEQMVEIGNPIVQASPPQDPAGWSNATSSVGLPAGNALAPATIRSTGGLFWTSWWDPFTINVAKVEDHMKWNYDGTSVTSVTSAYDNRSWFSFDGWTELSHTGPFLTNYGTRSTLETWDTFYNVPFCGGTWIQVRPNRFTGFGNGSRSGTTITWAVGCDANLLWWTTYLA
jgi:hypothetical protein